MAILPRPILKPALYVLGLLGTYHTWGRTTADGTLVHLLEVLHGGKEYILPGTDSPLRTSITGIYWPIDYLLDILIVFFWEAVDGSHPATSAIGIYFLAQYFSLLTGIYVDSLRLGQSRAITPVRTMLWLLLFQLTAIACTGPYWALWYIAASPLIGENVSFPELQRSSVAASGPLLLVLPSLAVGYVLPAVAMALPSPSIVSNDFQQLALVAWNVFPLGVFLVHQTLRAIFPSSRATSRSASAHRKAIRILNVISLLVSFTVLVALSTISLTTLLFPSLWAPGFISEFLPAALVIPPVSFTRGTTVGDGVRSFFLWDQVFGYLVAILIAWLPLRTVLVARGKRLGWVKLVVGIVGGAVIAGPGSVCLALNWTGMNFCWIREIVIEQARRSRSFPTLVPTLVTKVHIGDVNSLGVIHTESNLTHYGTPTGTIETVPGFEPAFKANVSWGADWLSFDPDEEHARINLKGIARTEQGHSIDFRYKGVIKMAPDVQKIFGNQPDMATVPFGYASELLLGRGTHTFIVADPALKELEHSTFVSNGRIIVHEHGLTVETRQSKVVPATVMD